MDLIYMDTGMQDVGVLHSYEMDLAFGADEMDLIYMDTGMQDEGKL